MKKMLCKDEKYYEKMRKYYEKNRKTET